MTIEEAIKHCEEKAKCGNACGLEHKQLADWLRELMQLLYNNAKSDYDEVLVDLDTVSEEQANSAADVQTLGYIFQKCESIKNFLEDLKDDDFRKKAYNRIKTLLPKEDA